MATEEKKARRKRRVERVKEVSKRAGRSVAERLREKRAKGAGISLATAAAAGYWEGGKNISDLVAVKPKEGETPSGKDLFKTDIAGFAAGAFALWSKNDIAYDVAMGLLPVTIHRMVKARTIRGDAGRPPKAPMGGMAGVADARAAALMGVQLQGAPVLQGAALARQEFAGSVQMLGDEEMGDDPELAGMAGYDESLEGAVEVDDGSR